MSSVSNADKTDFYSMFSVLFQNVDTVYNCKKENVLKCESFKRIKILLKHCDDIMTEKKEEEETSEAANKIHELIHEKLGQGTYTNTTLLNDFHHIKYEHKVDENIHKFDAIYNNLTNKNCDIESCKHLKRHYRDRTETIKFNRVTKDGYDDDNRYCLNLISRIHTYFIHSYDLNKMTIRELNETKSQLNRFKIDEEQTNIQEKELEILHKIMQNKKGNFLDNDKYTEANILDDMNHIEQYQLFMDVLSADGGLNPFLIFIHTQQYDTDALYEDLFELEEDQQQSNIFLYFRKHLNDKMNRIGLLKDILKKYKPVIDANNLLDQNEQNNAYILTQFCGLTNSNIDAAYSFLNATNWNLDVSIDRYYLFEADPTRLNKIIDDQKHQLKHQKTGSRLDVLNFEIELEEEDEKTSNDMVYSLGKKFWYWHSMKTHPNYVASKHKNIKSELLFHTDIDCNITKWNHLNEECIVKLNCYRVKRILSNGFNPKIYSIKADIPFSLQHMYAMILYTGYTKWCAMFCGFLRNKIISEISAVACWAKLLIECVQCFGAPLLSDEASFYRGINREFTFKKLVAQFNVPLSTSWDRMKAIEFAFKDSTEGLVMELCNFNSLNSVFKFDCSVMSPFPEEREVLFFGGDTILRIRSILQVVNMEYLNYRHYVEAIVYINELMNGLAINIKSITRQTKKAMKAIFNAILLETKNIENKKKIDEYLPKYVANKLVKYHLINRYQDVELDYDKLISEYGFLKSIFIKNKKNIPPDDEESKQENDEITLNIFNIGYLFQKVNKITINMPTDYVITKQFCLSLMHDLSKLSWIDCFFNKLFFDWCEDMPLENKFEITNLFAENCKELHVWQHVFSKTWIQIKQKEEKEEDLEQAEQEEEEEYEEEEESEDEEAMQNLVPTKFKCIINEQTQRLVAGYVRDIMRYIQKIIPMDIITLFYNYLEQTSRWDPTTSCDDKLTISSDGLSVSSQVFNYPKYIYSTMWMDNWLEQDGRYYFKFKFHGTLKPSSDEIATGFCTTKYDLSFDKGIGAEDNSYSWYCTGAEKSSIYVLKTHKRFKYGLKDNDEFSFEIFIENGGKSFYVNLLYERDGSVAIDEQKLKIEKLTPPIRVGVCFISRGTALSLDIIQQERPFTC